MVALPLFSTKAYYLRAQKFLFFSFFYEIDCLFVAKSHELKEKYNAGEGSLEELFLELVNNA